MQSILIDTYPVPLLTNNHGNGLLAQAGFFFNSLSSTNTPQIKKRDFSAVADLYPLISDNLDLTVEEKAIYDKICVEQEESTYKERNAGDIVICFIFIAL